MNLFKLWGVGVLSMLAFGGVACGGASEDTSEQDVGEQDVGHTSAALSGTPFQIRLNSNLLCLHDPGTGALSLDGCPSQNSDNWKFTRNGTGFFVQSYAWNTCVATWDQSTNQMALKLQSCATVSILDQARWRVLGRPTSLPSDSNVAYFKLQNIATGRCLTAHQTAHQTGPTWKISEDTCVSTVDPSNYNDNQILWTDLQIPN